MSAHHAATNPIGDFVLIAAFVSCWTSAGWSGRRAAKEIERRARRKDGGR